MKNFVQGVPVILQSFLHLQQKIWKKTNGNNRNNRKVFPVDPFYPGHSVSFRLLPHGSGKFIILILQKPEQPERFRFSGKLQPSWEHHGTKE